jgi:hypothetical protein
LARLIAPDPNGTPSSFRLDEIQQELRAPLMSSGDLQGRIGTP